MNRRELKSQIGVLESRLRWLTEARPKLLEGEKDYVLKENDVWLVGVTERADGSFSSVWMKVKHG